MAYGSFPTKTRSRWRNPSNALSVANFIAAFGVVLCTGGEIVQNGDFIFFTAMRSCLFVYLVVSVLLRMRAAAIMTTFENMCTICRDSNYYSSIGLSEGIKSGVYAMKAYHRRKAVTGCAYKIKGLHRRLLESRSVIDG